MAEHPIQNLMNVTMDKIRQMVDSNTIVGKPITTDDGTTILPVSKVSFGFASAGTDFDGKNAANKDLFGGGSGAGVNIQPVAFLVVKDDAVVADLAILNIVEPVDQVCDRCFSGTGTSNESDLLSWSGKKVYVVQNHFVRIVSKIDIIKYHITL